MLLINVLIILLAFLIILSLWSFFNRFLIYMGWQRREGLENMSSNTNTNTNTNKNDTSHYTDPGLNNDPLYLAKLNAANISYLKDQVDKLNGLKEQVTTLSSQTENNSTALRGIGDQLTASSQQLTGRDPNSKEPIPTATGLN
jgi:hypothetical protein